MCRNLSRRTLGQKTPPLKTKTYWLFSTLFEEESQLFKYHKEKHENMKYPKIGTFILTYLHMYIHICLLAHRHTY